MKFNKLGERDRRVLNKTLWECEKNSKINNCRSCIKHLRLHVSPRQFWRTKRTNENKYFSSLVFENSSERLQIKTYE